MEGRKLHGIQHTSVCRKSRRSLPIGQSDRNYSKCQLDLSFLNNLCNFRRICIDKSPKIFLVLLTFLDVFALFLASSRIGAAFTLIRKLGIWMETDGGFHTKGLKKNHVSWGDSTGFGLISSCICPSPVCCCIRTITAIPICLNGELL